MGGGFVVEVYMINVYTDEIDIVTKFDIMDVNTGETKLVTKEALYSAIELGRIKVNNINARGNRISGKGGEIKDYRTIVEDQYTHIKYINDNAVIIIGYNVENNLYRIIVARSQEVKIVHGDELAEQLVQQSYKLSNGVFKYQYNRSRKNNYDWEIIGKYPRFESVDSKDIARYKQKAKMLNSDVLRIVTFNNEVEASLDEDKYYDNCDIIIPNGVTRITGKGFNNKRFNRFIIPDTVKRIDNGALYRAKIDELLISVNNELTVGENVFTACRVNTLNIDTEEDTLPNKILTSMKVKKLVIPDNIRNLGKGQSIQLYDNDLSKYNLDIIKESTFDLIGDNEFKFPNNIKRIEENGIYGYNIMIDSLELPPSLEYVGSYGIKLNIKKLLISNKIELANAAFANCNIEELIIDTPMDVIEENTFNYNKFKHVEIRKYVREIKRYAFSNKHDCGKYNIKIAKLPSKIGRYAFCDAIFDTLIIDKQMDLGRGAFYKCAVNRIYVDLTIQKSHISILEKCLIGALVINSDKTMWSDIITDCKVTSLKLMGNLKSIEYEAFKKIGLRKIILNESIKSIGDRAFFDNDIKEIIIPANVEHIGVSAFGFNKAKKIVFNGNKSLVIENGAFLGNNVDYIKIPDRTVSEDNTFDSWVSITSK